VRADHLLRAWQASDDRQRQWYPVQNAFKELFIGGARRTVNETVFRSPPHARAVLEAWRTDYNTERPRSRLGWRSPGNYAALHRSAAPHTIEGSDPRTIRGQHERHQFAEIMLAHCPHIIELIRELFLARSAAAAISSRD
jgi:hypothetical protein